MFRALIIMALCVIAVERLLRLVPSLGIPCICHSHNNYRLLWMATAFLDICNIYRGRQTRPPTRPMEVDGKGMPLDSAQPNDGMRGGRLQALPSPEPEPVGGRLRSGDFQETGGRLHDS